MDARRYHDRLAFMTARRRHTRRVRLRSLRVHVDRAKTAVFAARMHDQAVALRHAVNL
jgi:hypothetical protein